MAEVGYAIVTGADCAQAAATKEGVLSVLGASTSGLVLVEFAVSFNGTSASAVPVLVQLDEYDATTGGTGTTVTPVQLRGQDITHGLTCKREFTAQPTNLTTIKEYLVHPQTGIVIQFPLSREPEAIESQGWLISATAPAAVSARGAMEVERT